MKPWRHIARPHKDVLEGTFKQSEFAADLSRVAAGQAPAEYQDAEKFFARTFITEGMRLLLISVAQRLTGQGGDPVIQLQTAFGGGKTHTLLAVYHMATRQVESSRLAGLPPLLDEAGITDLPRAHMAVLDGISFSPSSARQRGTHQVRTLWGELAWQLLGEEGYGLVAAADADGTSPGKDILIELLRRAAPCVILMDELLAFIRQLDEDRIYLAGTYDSNLSFIQALTEAMKAVPNAILLASLPESELEVGGKQGVRALNALEKYFARVESVWKPVATEEAFEIVRRRLFEEIGDPAERKATCEEFAKLYQQESSYFPVETHSSSYLDRLLQSYPIHPEIFDRLYEDWSTLEKFQRTRGVLQYLAMVIHRLWNSDNQDPLIMPGSLPLDDTNVRSKSIHYLPQGWEPVLEREVDGPHSMTKQVDTEDTRFGAIRAARRTARTIFLGSAPAAANQAIRGLALNRILLGTAQPGDTIGVYQDVLGRLRDRLHYLYSEQDRYWFDTKPNLRREMESRKRGFSKTEHVFPAIHRQLTEEFSYQRAFGGVHIFVPSSDLPDEIGKGPRLVVLHPDHPYSRSGAEQTLATAQELLQKRGDQPRHFQNRLIFLAADEDVVTRLIDQARTVLAWQSIIDDLDEGKLNLDQFQAKQSRERFAAAKLMLKQMTREAYKWLLAPYQERKGDTFVLRWESISINPQATDRVKEIEARLVEEEWLITQWSPVHLDRLLKQWYFTPGDTEVNAMRVWKDSCQYLYLPRLKNQEVFAEALQAGIKSQDYFAFAAGKDADRYQGFHFGDAPFQLGLSDHSLLIARETAQAYLDARQQPTPPVADPAPRTQGTGHTPTPPTHPIPRPQPLPPTPVTPATPASKNRFFGTVKLDPIRAKLDFGTIVDEVIQHFSSDPNTTIDISIEVHATHPDGFDESTQRTVRENAQQLGFESGGFE